MERARAGIEKAGGESGFPRAGDPALAHHPLEHFAQHYTMQAERDVHKAVVLGVAATQADLGEAPAAVPAPASVEDHLGANVELF